jgi:hypothetical protein
VVYGSENEKPTTKRTRILIWLWIGFGWWMLIVAALFVWVTVDYLRRGDQLGQVDRMKWGW